MVLSIVLFGSIICSIERVSIFFAIDDFLVFTNVLIRLFLVYVTGQCVLNHSFYSFTEDFDLYMCVYLLSSQFLLANSSSISYQPLIFHLTLFHHRYRSTLFLPLFISLSSFTCCCVRTSLIAFHLSAFFLIRFVPFFSTVLIHQWAVSFFCVSI